MPELSTGASGTLHGAAGSIAFDPGFTIITFSGSTLVDEGREGAVATGCGGLAHNYVDPLVESIFGLSSSTYVGYDLGAELEVSEAAEVLANDM